MELMNYNFQKLDVLGHCLVKKFKCSILFLYFKDESGRKVVDINLDYIMSTARESDGSGTVATERQFEVNSRGGGEPSSAGSNETGEIKTFIEIMHQNSNL